MLMREEGLKQVLCIHPGGLGDVCLSESVFLSLQNHFGSAILGLGNKRYLELFDEYFDGLEEIGSRKWLSLFGTTVESPGLWERIVLIGKDEEGRLRRDWQSSSRDRLIFIDMYPHGAFSPFDPGSPESRAERAVHVEAYQLEQLKRYGIKPAIKKAAGRKSKRVILYPEKGFNKEKVPVDWFVKLHDALRGKGIELKVLASPGMSVSIAGSIFIVGLREVKDFLAPGGIFVSSDSGMAHLAGALGLSTITIFTDFDPAIWHPRGANISLRMGDDPAVGLVENMVMERVGSVP